MAGLNGDDARSERVERIGMCCANREEAESGQKERNRWVKGSDGKSAAGYGEDFWNQNVERA